MMHHLPQCVREVQVRRELGRFGAVEEVVRRLDTAEVTFTRSAEILFQNVIFKSCFCEALLGLLAKICLVP